MKFRTRFSKRQSVKLIFKEKSRTQQQFKKECDVNTILERYNKTGQLPEMIKQNPVYGDFSEPLDYQAACDLILKANEQFDALPSKARERFRNSPQEFLEFATNPQNGPELVKMGLANPQEPPKAPEPPPEPPKAPPKADD